MTVHTRSVSWLEDPAAVGYAFHWPAEDGTARCGVGELAADGRDPGQVEGFQRCRRPGCARLWDDYRYVEPFTKPMPAEPEAPGTLSLGL